MQLKQLFGFCGSVLKCEVVGSQQQLALVEYSTPAVRCSLSRCVAWLASLLTTPACFPRSCMAFCLCAHRWLVGAICPCWLTDTMEQGCQHREGGHIPGLDLLSLAGSGSLVLTNVGQEASAGLAMHGMTVVDRALVVELAAAARDAAAAGPVNPFAALQMQQMHQARSCACGISC